MSLNLSGMLGDVSNLASSISLQDLIAQGAIGALVTVGVAGAQTQKGQDTLDFLHIFHKPATPTTPATTGVIQGGNVIQMSKFLAMTPDQQKMLEALGYTVVPG